MRKKTTVLLVEDNPADVLLIREILNETRLGPFAILEPVARLAAALQRLDEGGIDVVLLDLGLPDSQGFDTLLSVRAHAPRVPVVVLTVLDESLGEDAIGAGAQDYLVKGRIDGGRLGRSLRYSIGRQTLISQLEEYRSREMRGAEEHLLRSIVGARRAAAIARASSGRAFYKSSREIFAALVHLYDSALEEAVRSPGEVTPTLTELIEEVGMRLGALHAGPADALEVHNAALEVRERLLPAEQAAGVEAAARVTLFELIGGLAAYYREYTIDLQEISA